MASRIEVLTTGPDGRSETLLEKLQASNFSVTGLKILDVYTIDKDFLPTQLQEVGESLSHPVTQKAFVRDGKQDATYMQLIGPFDYAIEVGFMPGVTDNIGSTTQQIISDQLDVAFEDDEDVYSTRLHLIQGELSADQLSELERELANPLIQRTEVKTHDDFVSSGGMDIHVPKVNLKGDIEVSEVSLKVSDKELERIGKEGIANPDGSRRGPLGLGLDYMKAIRDYFKNVEKRNPTDAELETLAQTWSEHCKHTIFASAIDEIEDGIYRHFIKRATNDIRAERGDDDICVSVFKDNSGGIIFDDEYLITDKVETHNTPSALDPFGGAITGIVGVNRDCIGFGKGAKPVINRYGFCVADPRKEVPLYRSKGKKQPMLSARYIMEGVIEGVESGGNCSGIPTPQGFIHFDPRYRGKPLVFAGTVGLIPREVNGQPGHEKEAKNGDLIVMVGGRVGKDGIHGATFSSVELDEGSPVTAVQIGDPITQKKFSDVIVKEARDLGLYNSITDNGAGGLSSSVGEMAEQSGGFVLDLAQVPVKYPGLQPWEIWISESQERMTLAVPAEKIDALFDLLKRRGCEATVVGTFTNTGRAVLKYGDKPVMDISMDFLHDGTPPKQLKTKAPKVKLSEPELSEPEDYGRLLTDMLERPNIASHSFISTMYDHNVQGSAVIGPLQGSGKVNGTAAVSRPVLSSPKGVITSQGLAPRYSDIDTYWMSAAAIDMAVRSAITIGGNLEHLALLDNFCWCSSDEAERLYQLKQSAQACYDFATGFGTPYISGKDSMFNDFSGYDENGKPIKISVPPTLLVSALGVMEDHTKAISIDAKMPGDLVYVLGMTRFELGGSEYYDMHGALGEHVPQLDLDAAVRRYNAYSEMVEKGLISSAISVEHGGVGVALAKKALAGRMGLDITLNELPRGERVSQREDYGLFSESLGRILVTVAPENKNEFEAMVKGQVFARLGRVVAEPHLLVTGYEGQTLFDLPLSVLEKSYHSTFEGF